MFGVFFCFIFNGIGFALSFKVQLLIIVLTSGYLLAIAFCGLASLESMWWKCVLVGVNILGLSLLGLGMVIPAHTEVMAALIKVRKMGVQEMAAVLGLKWSAPSYLSTSLFHKEIRKCVPMVLFFSPYQSYQHF